MVFLGQFLHGATTDELINFRDDLDRLVQVFLPALQKHKSDIQLHLDGPRGLHWDPKSFGYQTNVISLGGPENLKDMIWVIIKECYDEEPGQVRKIGQEKPWFNESFPLIQISTPIVAVIERTLRGASLDDALDAEMREIQEMRNPWQERVAQFVIQNLVLEDETPLDFKTYTIETEEKEIRIDFQEDEKPHELRIEKIQAMSLALRSRIRRLKAEEYQEIAPRAVFQDNHGISTVVEFFYKLPEEQYSNSEAKQLIEKAMKERIKCFQRALMLTIYGDFPAAQIYPAYTNKYRETLFGNAFPLGGPKFHSNLFTGKKMLKKDFFPSLVELQEILLKMHDSHRIEEGLDLLFRAEGIMRIDRAQTIVMYWSFLEKFINGKGYFLMGIASYLYGCTNTEERRKEFDFLRTFNFTRNGYVHGNSMENLNQNIKNYYPIHNIGSIALVCREKVFRIFLFSLLLLYHSRKAPDNSTILFNWGKERLLGKGWQPQSEGLFNRWIHKGDADELGILDKYRTGYRTSIRMI